MFNVLAVITNTYYSRIIFKKSIISSFKALIYVRFVVYLPAFKNYTFCPITYISVTDKAEKNFGLCKTWTF